jgi:hypothetical protein
LQAEIFVRKYFRLTESELDNLDDEQYCLLAAQAHFLRKQEREAVAEGIALAFAKEK